MSGVADYELVRHRSNGNHGAYWVARPPARLGLPEGTVVDLKVLDRQASQDDFNRIVGELRIASQVRSEHLVPVLDAGHEKGRLFIAMPHYPEGELVDLVGSGERERIIRAVADAARGAHDLHEAGVVHRDIRPENIHLDGDRARLGDLGLAGVLDPAATATGIGPVGMVEYLAPEQVRGERSGRASDVWALGVTLHRCLTGESLYPAVAVGTLVQGLKHVLSSAPTIRLAAGSPEAQIVTWCLAADPMQRPATAAELAAALDQLGGAAR